MDYAVKKDRSSSPPKYLIFFKGRDADALTAAFTEYTSKKVKKAGLSLNQATASSTLPGIMVSVHCGRRRVIMECNKRAAGTSSSIMILR